MTTWKTVDSFPDYEVSTLGSVRRIRDQKLIREDPNSIGYLRVTLYRRGVLRRYFVHRLVLEVFVGPCQDGLEAAHDDGNKTNNRLSNLRWTSHVNNIRDKKRHGTDNRGENHSMVKLTSEDIKTIRSDPRSSLKIENLYPVCSGQIRRIRRRQAWAHV